MSILYSTIRTLFLDKVINAFFDNIATAFSRFDLLNGIREFDEIIVKDQYNKIILHYRDVKVTSIWVSGLVMCLEIDRKMNMNGGKNWFVMSGTIIATSIISAENDKLVLKRDQTVLLKNRNPK